MARLRKRRRAESDADFVERVARTRGRLERRFWARAAMLKERLAHFEALARGMRRRALLALAQSAARGANRAYLDEDLERAIRQQARAPRILRQMDGSAREQEP